MDADVAPESPEDAALASLAAVDPDVEAPATTRAMTAAVSVRREAAADPVEPLAERVAAKVAIVTAIVTSKGADADADPERAVDVDVTLKAEDVDAGLAKDADADATLRDADVDVAPAKAVDAALMLPAAMAKAVVADVDLRVVDAEPPAGLNAEAADATRLFGARTAINVFLISIWNKRIPGHVIIIPLELGEEARSK